MSNHPEFTELKKKRVKDLQPGVKEGWLRKKGFEVHSWKKRYFIIKNKYIFYFANANPNSTPKGVIELNSKSHASVTDDTFMNILITSVHRDQEVIADTPDMGAAWVDAINNHVKTLKKVEDQKKDEQKKVIIPFTGKEWPEIKTEINICKHQNDGFVPPMELLVLLKRFGRESVERYFYNILAEGFHGWDDESIAEFVWIHFCRKLYRMEKQSLAGKLTVRSSVMKNDNGVSYRLLTDLNMALGGTQDVVINAFGEEMAGGDVIMVVGRSAEAGKRLANIYLHVIDNNEISFSEIIRTILDAMEQWRMRTDESMFTTFVTGITQDWKPVQVATLVGFLTTYTTEHNSFPMFEEPWGELPQHAISFIKWFVSSIRCTTHMQLHHTMDG